MSFRRTLSSLWIAFIFLMAVLAGCSSLQGNQSAADPEVTITPSPTPDRLGYQAVAPQACLLNDFSSMQSDQRQGNLLAWRPDQYELAFIEPAVTTSWYSGSLSLVTSPNFSPSEPMAGNLMATGDLTWSPDGAKLAFLALRINESVETVMVVNADGSGLTDLFPLIQPAATVASARNRS